MSESEHRSKNLLSFIESDDSNKNGLNEALEEYKNQNFKEPLLASTSPDEELPRATGMFGASESSPKNRTTSNFGATSAMFGGPSQRLANNESGISAESGGFGGMAFGDLVGNAQEKSDP